MPSIHSNTHASLEPVRSARAREADLSVSRLSQGERIPAPVPVAERAAGSEPGGSRAGDGMRAAHGIAAPDPVRAPNGPEGVPRSAAPRVRRSSGGDAGAAPEVSLDTAYMQSLRESLDEWVDYGKAGAQAGSAQGILQAVLAQHGVALSGEAPFDLSQIEDDGWVDEAALLYHLVQNGGANRQTAAPPLAQLRAAFEAKLRAEDVRRQSLDSLLAPPQDPAGKAPYFDGFVLRNAFGKTFDELLQSPDISSDPAFRGLPVEQKRSLLEARFAEMGESTQYRIGTPEHSLASILIRMAKFAGQPAPAPFASTDDLAAAFMRAENQWEGQRDSFPLHPRLYYAMHLAQSSGVETMSTAQLEQRYNAILKLAVQHRERTGDWDPQLWLQSVPSKWNADGSMWNQRGDAVKQEALLATLDALRAMSERETRPPGLVAERVWNFAQTVKQAGLLGEVLAGTDHKEQLAAVLTHGQERLQVNFGTPTKFEPLEAARSILRGYGMSEEQLNHERRYTLLTVEHPLGEQRVGTPADEFLERARLTFRLPRIPGTELVAAVAETVPMPLTMQVGNHVFTPMQELQKAEVAYNAALPTNPWVRARAQENLRMASSTMTRAQVEAEIRRIAPDYQVETEYWRAAKSVGWAVITQVPFLGGGARIIDGIRNKDINEVLLGVGSIMLDYGPARGGKPSIKLGGLEPHLRQGASDFHAVTTKLNIPTVQVSDHAEFFAERAPGRFGIGGADETPQVGLRDGNVPPEFRPLAQQVRNGEAASWNGHQLVRLANEDRVVPVRERTPGVYEEIEWHTGERSRERGLIRRDPASNTYRSDLRLKGGGKFLDSWGRSVKKRITAMDVRHAISQANDLGQRNFRRVFADYFAMRDAGAAMRDWEGGPHGNSTIAIENVTAFLEGLYQRSHTFRRLFNRFDDVSTRSSEFRNQWLINFGGSFNRLGIRVPTVYWGERAIDFPASVSQIQGVHFTSANASGLTPYSKENMVLHELLHVMTTLKDPGMGHDRGAIVYLTDKILNEAGHDFEERVTYLDTYNGSNDPLWRDAVKDAHVENRLLDPMLDASRFPPTGDTLVQGQPLRQRVTVAQWQELPANVRQAPAAAVAAGRPGPVPWQSLQDRFQFQGAERRDGRSMHALTRLSQRFLKKSPTFRALLANMPQRPGGKWQFEFGAEAARTQLEHPLSGAASAARGKIYLFDDGTLYLSEKGTREVEYERRVALGFVNAMTGLAGPSSEAALQNRGAVVRLVDRILAESGFRKSEQLLAARAMPDEASLACLLSYQTSARRSAATEDAFLAQ